MTDDPLISILCPTRGRPGNVRRLIESALSTAEHPIEFVFYMDKDDLAVIENHAAVGDAPAQILVGPRIVLSRMWNVCYNLATANILMHCGDDIVFQTPGWDTKVVAEFTTVEDRILFVHGDDGIQGGKIGTHGFLHRRWCETVGYFVPPWFSSDFNDMWLTEVADAIGRRRYLPDVYTEHMHPVVGKGPLDQTHQERLHRHAADDCDALYKRTERQRQADAEKLRMAIAAAAGG